MSRLRREWQLADDPAATERLGASLARALGPGGAVIGLSGELGAGKTTLVRGLLRGLGHAGRVPSPSYTLVEPYDLGGRQVLHVDLYRLSAEGELAYLGLGEPDPLRDLLLIEWPERAPTALPPLDLALLLAHADAGRHIVAESRSPRGDTILGGLPASGYFI